MPILYDELDQGSPEWRIIRLGIPTASNFSRLQTGASRQFGDKAHKYAEEKVAEIITGMDQGSDYISDEMEMGQITEQEAADSYEFANEVKTRKVGFITDDEGFYGCSPDRLVGDAGGVEIKRKIPAGMVKYLLLKKIDPAHRAQVQGNMMVTGRLWWDWHLYNPDMPRLTIRTYRDERYIAELKQDVLMFRQLVLAKLKALALDGYIDLEEIAERAVAARKNIKGIYLPAADPDML